MARTPSAEAHEAVLTTALKLMTDRGIEGTSVDEIAEASGVSKATIYKHWSSKDVLCIEAISRLKSDLPIFDSGDPRSDAVALLQHLAQTKKPEALCKIWPRIIGYAAENPAFANAFRARIEGGQRAQLGGLLRSAIDKGELRADLEIEMALDVLLGPVVYRRFMQTPVPPELPEHVVDSFWRLNSPQSALLLDKEQGRKNGEKSDEKITRPNGSSRHLRKITRRIG